MNIKDDIILILDSILDDYYFLWECFDEYKHYRKNIDNPLAEFSQALKSAYGNGYFNFFIGVKFNGDEELIPEFELTDSAIEELLDSKNIPEEEIRITTSLLGIAFLKQHRSI